MTTVLRQIGVITRPHGLRGEVKVRPETDDPGRFEELDAVYVGRSEEDARLFRIRNVRFQPLKSGTAVVLALEGVEDREAVDALGGMTVWADEDALPPLGDDEVYVSDLVGLRVSDDAGTPVGMVRDVLDLPAQPVLVVERSGGGEVLIPFVHALIASVDEEQIVVRPLEGLLDPDQQEEAD